MEREILTPMLGLVVWTFVIWFWMYATRLPAIKAAKLDAAKIKRKSDLDSLPLSAQQVADNYNHLHEQPVVFYALITYTYLAGNADAVYVTLAWSYVGIRVVHSLIQCTFNFVPVRFTVFSIGSFVLMAIAVRNLAAL